MRSMKALGLLIFSLAFCLTATASLGPYAPRFWFSTTYQDVFYGSDCYADGSPVLEGECYALVWQANDVPFQGFNASGTYGLSYEGEHQGTLPVDPENCHVLEVWPAAAKIWVEPDPEWGIEGGWTSYCPGASNVVHRDYYIDHTNTGHFAVYLFDTRRWVGNEPVVTGCDAKTRTVPVLNGYGVVSGLENIEMVPGSDWWTWNITTQTGQFNPYGTALPSYGDFNDDFDVVPTLATSVTEMPSDYSAPVISSFVVSNDVAELTVSNTLSYVAYNVVTTNSLPFAKGVTDVRAAPQQGGGTLRWSVPVKTQPAFFQIVRQPLK